MPRVWCFILFALISQSANAAQGAAALGAGTFTCAQFANDYKANPGAAEGIYYGWAQGFMSGLNLARFLAKQPGRSLSAKSVREHKSHLRGFCAENPLVDYGRAVFLMYDGFPHMDPP